MDVSQLLPTVTVAKLLGKDRRTVVRMARDGRLPVAIELPGYRGDLLFDAACIEAIRGRKRSSMSQKSSGLGSKS